jgi:cytochrome b pre-mRNA-processing protein 3
MLNVLKRGRERRAQSGRLYAAAVARAREPVFFATFGVADTLDGRFDLVVLHACLLLERLNTDDPALAQAFVDALFTGFDEGLRELGVGDIGIGKKVKKLADAFYGRLKAYGEAQDETAMAAALIRNLYRGEEGAGAGAVARYVLAARALLANADLSGGEADFGPLPWMD